MQVVLHQSGFPDAIVQGLATIRWLPLLPTQARAAIVTLSLPRHLSPPHHVLLPVLASRLAPPAWQSRRMSLDLSCTPEVEVRCGGNTNRAPTYAQGCGQRRIVCRPNYAKRLSEPCLPVAATYKNPSERWDFDD